MFTITYESKMDYEDDFYGPFTVKIPAADAYKVREKFADIFRKCFGASASFWILSIDKA